MLGKIFLGLGAIGTVGGSSIGGFYLYSKDTIWNHVKDRVLGSEEGFNDSWKFKFKQIKEESQEGFSELENIKKEHSDDEVKGAEALKGWCSKSYSYVYKNVFSSEDKERLKKTERYCIQSWGEKFTSLLQANHKVLGTGANEAKADYDANYKKIEVYDETKKSKLPEEVRYLKSAEIDNKWNILQGWCKRIQSKPFTGVESAFEIGKDLCIKTN